MTRIVRVLALAEIQTLLDWAAAEGWNPGLNDAVPFEAADPNGFFGAFVEGQMVAAISAVAYDAEFGFIGLYICHPAWRGQGYGKAVWDAAMDYLGNRTIGLDGVPAQQANYASMGFVPAYDTIRMSGTLPVSTRPSDTLQARVEDIRALDRQCFPASRDGFLASWLQPPHRGLAHRTDGAIDGYAVSRRCVDGQKLGPLFANTLNVAMDLLAVQSGIIHLDVPANQVEWLAALSSLGFTDGFRTRRMYRGTPPVLDMEPVFAVSSLELG